MSPRPKVKKKVEEMMVLANNGIPQWYMDTLVNVEDDTIIIKWEYDEEKEIHEGYCRFCNHALYLDNKGDVNSEWEHMQSNHEAEISIYRLQTI